MWKWFCWKGGQRKIPTILPILILIILLRTISSLCLSIRGGRTGPFLATLEDSAATRFCSIKDSATTKFFFIEAATRFYSIGDSAATRFFSIKDSAAIRFYSIEDSVATTSSNKFLVDTTILSIEDSAATTLSFISSLKNSVDIEVFSSSYI